MPSSLPSCLIFSLKALRSFLSKLSMKSAPSTTRVALSWSSSGRGSFSICRQRFERKTRWNSSAYFFFPLMNSKLSPCSRTSLIPCGTLFVPLSGARPVLSVSILSSCKLSISPSSSTFSTSLQTVRPRSRRRKGTCGRGQTRSSSRGSPSPPGASCSASWPTARRVTSRCCTQPRVDKSWCAENFSFCTGFASFHHFTTTAASFLPLLICMNSNGPVGALNDVPPVPSLQLAVPFLLPLCVRCHRPVGLWILAIADLVGDSFLSPPQEQFGVNDFSPIFDVHAVVPVDEILPIVKAILVVRSQPFFSPFFHVALDVFIPSLEYFFYRISFFEFHLCDVYKFCKFSFSVG
mmetsp:Transcript_3329/g.11475  ORF Transcript_3329/g.11475 Transcript_3329/m.11475 type:complete len:350 (+) Transcript_3329:865-1914(+)